MIEQIKIFTNSAIVVNRVIQLLDENEIQSLTKDNVESGRLAGFGTSYYDVELYVYKADVERAEKIIKSFLDNE